MEMIESYIYEVIKSLAPSQREDIAKELRGLIDDMLDERTRERSPSGEDVMEVLEELGDPARLAENYRGKKRYLIGPALFDTYVNLLKIVLFAIVIAMTVGLVVETIMDQANLIDHFTNYVISLITTSMGGFAWVTLIFAFIEYKGMNAENIKVGNHKPWKPTDLSPVPDPKRQIKRTESIVGIMFSVFALVIVLFFSQYIGPLIVIGGEKTIVPFFNQAVFSKYVPFVICVIGIAILKECLKIISGKWTLKLLISVTFINIIALITVLMVVTKSAFWNPTFMQELVQTGIVAKGSEAYSTINAFWEHSISIVALFIVIGLVVDAVHGLIKIRK